MYDLAQFPTMTNTHKKRLISKDDEMDRDVLEELRVGETRLASAEDLDSLQSQVETCDYGTQRRVRRPFLYRIWKFLQVTATEVIKGEKLPQIELELPQRYRPTTIRGLSQATGFSQEEIKKLYWSFKTECPTGLVNQENFRQIFSKFFPTGANLSSYSDIIFASIDQQNSGVINFEDFALELSTLLLGSVEDKLRWIFKVYDLNKDGVLSRAEIKEVTASIYDLMGHPSGEKQSHDYPEELIAARAELAFKKLDLDCDGVISEEDFITSCLTDQNISKSLKTFDCIRII